MEQIETQVNDLQYLAQAGPGSSLDDIRPIPPPEAPRVTRSLQPPAPTTPSSASEGGRNKRKRDDGVNNTNTKVHRNKRNRDDSSPSTSLMPFSHNPVHSNECKRRKIKCNGETPCQRCGNLNLSCLYAPNCCGSNLKDSGEFYRLQADVSRLKDQVNELYQTVAGLRDDHQQQPSSPIALSSPPRGPLQNFDSGSTGLPALIGPTSTASSLDITGKPMSNTSVSRFNPGLEQGARYPVATSDLPGPQQSIKDPLFQFSGDEMVRLCRIHEEEVDGMYPVIDIQSIIEHARAIGDLIECHRLHEVHSILSEEKTLQLKMVMCCALVVEGHGHSESAHVLYDSMDSVLNRKLMVDQSSVSSLPVLTLLAGFRFLSGDELLAWRVIGQVTRLCLELGINRLSGIDKIEDHSESHNALNCFWSAYVMDRSWSFGTGYPYVIHDTEIDPDLPLPEWNPYLMAMVTYSRLGAKVRRQVSQSGPILARELREEEVDNLDDEILRWYESVPEEVRIHGWDRDHQQNAASYAPERFRAWTYLALNQIRIWLHAPVLHNTTNIMDSFPLAERAVDIAKDTVRYLAHINNTTNLYRNVQVFYHQYLASAIIVIFLASVHAPARFGGQCRGEFYLALALVQELPAKSCVSKRLWRTIDSLKQIAHRSGHQKNDGYGNEINPPAEQQLTQAFTNDNNFQMTTPRRAPYAAGQRIKRPGNLPSQRTTTATSSSSEIRTEMARMFEDSVTPDNIHSGLVANQVSTPHDGLIFAMQDNFFSHFSGMI